MDFYEVLDQVIDLLRSRGRVTYRALKRQFDLNHAFLEDLKYASYSRAIDRSTDRAHRRTA